MSPTPAPAAPALPADEPAASPWDALDAEGTGLTVDNFITTRMSMSVNAMRRTITLPYAQAAGLTVPEWRILSLVAHAKQVAFSVLVVQSTSDKALVSRTVRSLEQAGLVSTHTAGNTPRKKLTVSITPEGDARHDEVIGIARRRQAQMIRTLTPLERRAMFSGLQKLLAACQAEEGFTDMPQGAGE